MSTRLPTVPMRALVIISTVALTVLLLASAGFASGTTGATDRPVMSDTATGLLDGSLVEHRVARGDTLWSIAGDVSGGDADLRGRIDEIKDLNDLAGSTIRIGQVLLVPATP